MKIKEILLTIARALVKPIGKLLAAGAIKLVNMTKEYADNELLIEFAEGILARRDELV